jgi:hypothetical protein
MMRKQLAGPTLLLAFSCGGEVVDVGTSAAPLLSLQSSSYSGTQLTSYKLYTSNTLAIYESTDPYAGIGPNGPSYGSGATISAGPGTIGGFDLVGMTVWGSVDGVGEVELRVVDAELGTGRTANVYYYRTEYRFHGTWFPLCGTDANGDRVRNLAVPGTWDQRSGVIGGGAWRPGEGSTFTFACEKSSIAKCVELGYFSSLVDRNGVPRHLLSCVRAMRADYCGDGRSWTSSGRTIEIWDDRSINTRAMQSWPRESGWAPEGATCLDAARLEYPDDSPTPSCSAMLDWQDCGSRNARWTVMNSFEPPL